jgi:hypothetical protein
MKHQKWKTVAAVAAIAVLALACTVPSSAQNSGGTLSGTVTDPSGKPATNAKVSVKNLASGEASETRTNSAGVYSVANLASGDYEVSIKAEGFSTNTSKVSIARGGAQILNFTLAGVLSLGDLGFPAEETQGNAKEQARLDKRSHMLKIHQRIGLIATAPIVASETKPTSPAGFRRRSPTSKSIRPRCSRWPSKTTFLCAWT